MIPAIIAAPMVESVLGGLVNGVMSVFSPSEPTAPPAATNSSFGSSLNQAASAVHTAPSAQSFSTGIMRATEWNRMSSSDVQSWAQSLAGRHVDATDASGRTISGLVTGMQMMGSVPALNIGGHLVSLSQLKQISWSPSVA